MLFFCFYKSIEVTVLNIVRVARDIGRYLVFFACCRYDMGKSFAHIICSKKRPIFEIWVDKPPDMSRRKIGRYEFILIEFIFFGTLSIEPISTRPRDYMCLHH